MSVLLYMSCNFVTQIVRLLLTESGIINRPMKMAPSPSRILTQKVLSEDICWSDPATSFTRGGYLNHSASEQLYARAHACVRACVHVFIDSFTYLGAGFLRSIEKTTVRYQNNWTGLGYVIVSNRVSLQ